MTKSWENAIATNLIRVNTHKFGTLYIEYLLFYPFSPKHELL
jgi:hypothetical protein